MKLRPIDIARKLNISTSALRHYEDWGIVPPIERGANGYRIYTEVHVAYFECIRALSAGFGMQLTADVMRKLQAEQMDAALWMVNESQASLYQDKLMAEKTIQLLDELEMDEWNTKGRTKWMTIGEISEETSIPTSVLRHWEQEGLITVERDPQNGYRRYNRSHIKRVLLIRSLRTAIYSLDTIKEALQGLDHNNIEQARKIAYDSLQHLHKMNKDQLRGTHYLYRLCKKLKLIE
ncbi:MerR family transcriptional regulator [Paenibacillus sp. SC116]|uniref:MerR family transcriptional regulator n=1 Tax=Paenibacillus sp. SC116 TaxID=2968986 RepID=UPI00215A1039|nr:MerR family transcriptional regulator [Paenibacillus sp. SC116]MCR8842256.1 MerR family transcriptional regulator [Paenibacillus sp. SC116]